MSESQPFDPGEFEGLTCSPDLRLRILHRVPFFRQLSHEAVHEINELFRESGFIPGEQVIAAGEPATELYIVARGNLKMQRYTPQGQNVIVDLLTAGDLFGGLPILGEEIYEESVEAHSPGCMLGIGANEFRMVLDSHPTVGTHVLEFVSGRLRDAHDQIRLLSASAVQERLAAILLRLSRKLTGAGESGRLPLSQQDLADMSGSTIETVNRTLKRFREQGAVETGRGWVAVRDSALLEEQAQG